MTISKSTSQRGVKRAGGLTLMLLAGILLVSCTGQKSSSAVVPQGAAEASPVAPSNAENATLGGLHGTVEVRTGKGQWTLAQPGQMLSRGQHIRTGALSNATLAFYDRSQMYLGAEAEITLDVVDARTSGARLVQLTQTSGESQHTVTLSTDPGSRYDVNTPTGNGSGSGTTFTVIVLPGRLSQFWVETGVVSVTNANTTVVVVAGQTSSALVGQPPLEPMFRISGEGQVMSSETGRSGTGGLAAPRYAPQTQADKITLCHATGSMTNPYVEITVAMAGATHGHAKHSGDIIPAPAAGCPQSASATATFSVPTRWTIAGQPFLTGASTIIFGNPQPGDWVSFEGHQQADGSHFADRIVLASHRRDNQFTFIGKVEIVSDTAWIISGRMVQIDAQTIIEAGLTVGDNVRVMGAMASDNTFWATRLSRTEGSGSNFRFAGILTSLTPDLWVISGIKVTIGVSTTLNGEFVVGNPVVVEGLIREDGTWLATSINLVMPGEYRFEFIGPVQSLNPWRVADISFGTAEWTEIDADLTVGTQVRVTGLVSANGVWVAEKIERINTGHATSFDLIGPIISMTPWNVRGVALIVDQRTTLKGELIVGEMVKVTGWILDDGTWLATEIKHTGLHLGQGCYLARNVVQSFTDDEILLVDGQTLMRTSDLEVQGELKEASIVSYQFCVDQLGQGKFGRVIVIYQLTTLPASLNGPGGKVVICHIPPGNPGNQHTIEVGQPAVSAHLAHGDTLGSCVGGKTDKKP